MKHIAKALLATASLEELGVDITLAPEETSAEIAPEVIEDSDQAVAEIIQEHHEVEGVSDQVDDLIEVAESLESIALDFESFAGNGGMSQGVAVQYNRTVGRLCRSVGLEGITLSPSLEDFGGEGTRVGATTASLEGLRDQLKVFWAAILNGIKKAWVAVSNFFTNLFAEVPRLQKRAAALAKAAGEAKGAAAGKWEAPAGAAIHVGGKADAASVKKGLEALKGAIDTVFKDTVSAAPEYYGKIKAASEKLRTATPDADQIDSIMVTTKSAFKYESPEVSGGKKIKPSTGYAGGLEVVEASGYSKGETDIPSAADVKAIAGDVESLLSVIAGKKSAVGSVASAQKEATAAIDSAIKSLKEAGNKDDAAKAAVAKKLMKAAATNLSGFIGKVSSLGLTASRGALAYGERAVKAHGKAGATQSLPKPDDAAGKKD